MIKKKKANPVPPKRIGQLHPLVSTWIAIVRAKIRMVPPMFGWKIRGSAEKPRMGAVSEKKACRPCFEDFVISLER